MQALISDLWKSYALHVKSLLFEKPKCSELPMCRDNLFVLFWGTQLMNFQSSHISSSSAFCIWYPQNLYCSLCPRMQTLLIFIFRLWENLCFGAWSKSSPSFLTDVCSTVGRNIHSCPQLLLHSSISPFLNTLSQRHYHLYSWAQSWQAAFLLGASWHWIYWTLGKILLSCPVNMWGCNSKCFTPGKLLSFLKVNEVFLSWVLIEVQYSQNIMFVFCSEFCLGKISICGYFQASLGLQKR